VNRPAPILQRRARGAGGGWTFRRVRAYLAPMDSSEPSAAGAEPRTIGRGAVWLFVSVLWLAFALVLTTQHYLGMREAGQDASWLRLFGRQAQLWGVWALLTPVVFAVARRVPIHPGRVLSGLAAHLPIAVGFIALHTFITGPLAYLLGIIPDHVVGDAPTLLSVFGTVLRGNISADLLIYSLLVAIHHVAVFGSAARLRDVQASQLETQLARARLDALQMQLQPHFLFNTLHAVSALMDRDVAAARRMLTRLGELLRLSLTSPETQEVVVEDELAFLGRYIDIQRMRFHDRLVVNVDVDPGTRRAMVPRLLMQPLVENAIRHGIATRTGPGRIAVNVVRENGQLHLSVTDNGRGLPPGGMNSIRFGVGLRNTRARLEHLYGSEQRFELIDAPGGGTIASVRIPFREGAPR
jgi:two-component system, LytTR family, sensor kinase